MTNGIDTLYNSYVVLCNEHGLLPKISKPNVDAVISNPLHTKFKELYDKLYTNLNLKYKINQSAIMSSQNDGTIDIINKFVKDLNETIDKHASATTLFTIVYEKFSKDLESR